MQSLILCRKDELGKGNGRAGKRAGKMRSMDARRIKTDSEKMEENGVCKPMDLCRKDKW